MSKKHFLRGLRDGIPIGLGYFAVSFGIGISAHNAHLSIFQGFLLSFLNNASSGEYGGITIIAADSGLWAMALMMLVVNARYLLMSCALSQRLSPDTPLPWRLLIAYDLKEIREDADKSDAQTKTEIEWQIRRMLLLGLSCLQLGGSISLSPTVAESTVGQAISY